MKDLETKKEPAPAATDTDSKTKNEIEHQSTDNDNTLLRKCQAELPLLKEDFIDLYNNMSEAEQRAWDLGQMYARVLRMRGE